MANKQPNLRLLGDRVLVKVVAIEQTVTGGGIIIPPAGEDEAASQGIVILMSGKVRIELEPHEKFDIGDRLLFGQHAGTKLNYNGESYKVIRVTDIFSVIDPKIAIKDVVVD